MQKYEPLQPFPGPLCGHLHCSLISLPPSILPCCPPASRPSLGAWHLSACVHAVLYGGPVAIALQTWASGNPEWGWAWRKGPLVSLNCTISDRPLEASQPAGQGCPCFLSQRVRASGWLDPASSSPPLKHQLETSAQRMLCQ